MSEELQSLLDRINADGIQKAEAERARIIAEATAEAAALKDAAKSECDALKIQAEKDAEALKNRAISAASQAARDIMLQLRSELNSRLEAAIGDAVSAALTPEFMTQLIRELAAAFAASPDSDLSVRAAVRDLPALDAALKNALAESFKKAPRLFASREISSGMQIEFNDNNVCFDFSGEAVSELLTAYAGSRLAEIFKA